MNLGIDIGASAIKLAGVRGGKLVFKRYIHGKPDIFEALESSGIRMEELDGIGLTGVGADKVDTEKLSVPHRLITEFDAIGKGAAVLSGRDRIVVASIGTGTAFVAVDGDSCRHLGGTGLGGGALGGLGKLLGVDDAKEVVRCAMEGDLSKVDLSIGDVLPGSDLMDPRITAANLAKVMPDAKVNDWCAGITNLVLQAVGTMGLLCTRIAGVGCVVATGALAVTEAAQINFHNFQKIYGVDYVIPPHAECATAFGAALLVK